MPIASIITQPVTNSIMASYRPVVFIVRATSTSGTAKPPVVYCDVYVNGVFANTISKTQYSVLNSGDSDWMFDIQDICQKSIGKYISKNGGTIIDNPPELFKTVYCKFRSSGITTQGFLQPEGTAPIQATSNTPAIDGTGTVSHSFYILNVALQHASKQNLADHLTVFKTGIWASNAWPLSHRIAKYKIGINNSDYFPFFYAGAGPLDCLNLGYKLKGQTTFTVVSTCGQAAPPPPPPPPPPTVTCSPVAFSGAHTLPDGVVGTPYTYQFALAGDAPFELNSIVKPDWMTIVVSGSNVIFSGTPTITGTGIAINFMITNCSSNSTQPFSDTIDITAAAAVPVDMYGYITNTPHSVKVNLASGSTPLSCPVTFSILGTYDHGGLSEFDASVILPAGDYDAERTGLALDGVITCIKPTTAGTNIFVQETVCGGITYRFTMTIFNPC